MKKIKTKNSQNLIDNKEDNNEIPIENVVFRESEIGENIDKFMSQKVREDDGLGL